MAETRYEELRIWLLRWADAEVNQWRKPTVASKIYTDAAAAIASLPALVEATEKTIADIRLFSKCFDDGSASKDFCIGVENRLVSVLNKIKGGA